jgi:WD40 repeat protein
MALRPTSFCPVGVTVIITAAFFHGGNASAQKPVEFPQMVGVRTLAFSPNGKVLAVGVGHEIKLYDLDKQRQIERMEHKGGVTSVSYSPDGKWLASLAEGNLKLWKMANRTEKWEITDQKHRPQCFGFSPDGKLLATGGIDEKIRTWDPETGDEKTTFEGLPGPVTYIAFWPPHPDPNKPVGAGHIRIAGAASRGATVKVWDLYGKEKATFKRGVTGLVFTADGKGLLSAGNPVTLWDIAMEKEPVNLPTHRVGVHAIAISPDGKFLAIPKYGVMSLFDLETAKEVADLPERFIKEVWCVAFSPDGTKVAAAGLDGVVRVWDVSKFTKAKK